MKYWRGYLVAAIVAACTWALERFAEGHTRLVDMVYPYVTRMAQDFLAGWSGSVEFCLWQVLLVALGVLVLASAVLMLVLKWNPIQWFGWVLAVASIVALLSTGIYGLNKYAGPIAQDIRLEEEDYTVSELQSAARFFRNKANKLIQEGNENTELAWLNEQTPNGFEYMKTQQYQSVFAGSTAPVKELGFGELFAKEGIDGIHVGITGEAAVNLQMPAVGLPFAVSRVMANRMCIADEADAMFAAFLTCRGNENPSFQYAAYLYAYRVCHSLLAEIDKSTGKDMAQTVQEGAADVLVEDMQVLDAFYGEQNPETQEDLCKLLVSLYIQEEVLPLQIEEEVLFDPLDETQVDLSGLVNAGS